MVSNILSWVELLSSGVVSDLEEEKQRMGEQLEAGGTIRLEAAATKCHVTFSLKK